MFHDTCVFCHCTSSMILSEIVLKIICVSSLSTLDRLSEKYKYNLQINHYTSLSLFKTIQEHVYNYI